MVNGRTFRTNHWLQLIGAHGALLLYTFIALFPIYLVVINSFKDRKFIFKTPYALPSPENFNPVGYQTVFARAQFPTYFLNSIIVTTISLLLIFPAGTMAAHALSEYKFRGNGFLGLYLALGIMIPIRL